MAGKFLLLTTIVLLGLHPQESKQSKFSRFGTKTAYHYDNTSDSSLKYPDGCQPIHLNMVIRHGSRYPSDGDREEIDDLLTKLNEIYTVNSPFHYQNLTLPWNEPPEWKDAAPGELSTVGENEQYSIAKRFRARFPEVFIKEYWNKYYKFVTSDKLRTAQSAMSFAFGLFEARGPVTPSKFQPVAISFSGRENADRLLSSYNSCPRYEIDVDEHGVAEVEKFIEGPEIKNVTKRLEERLQITGKLSLTFDFVEKIFRLCAFGVMNRGDNTWCALLDDEIIKVLDYQSDLKSYYEHSYGNELNRKIECTLLSDITQNLRDFSVGKSELQGVFRFTSSGTLVSLLTILGLSKDPVPLRADNFIQQNKRQFRVSNMAPMSANFAVVLYACNSTEKAGKLEHKLQVLWNEKPVALPCCHGNTTCSLGEFLSCFNETVDNCDFDAMCSLPPTGKPKALASIFSPEQLLISLSIVFSLFVLI
ncbi:multiple inositol polyphosphate phosphatase 1-like [Oculina patagonica]